MYLCIIHINTQIITRSTVISLSNPSVRKMIEMWITMNPIYMRYIGHQNSINDEIPLIY